MKFHLKPFPDTRVTPVYRDNDGAWVFDEYPPLGGEICRGPFPTRAAARDARRTAVADAKGSGAIWDMEWARAGR
jgi:hypothetical protein